MLVQCTQRERGEREAGGVHSARPDDEPHKDAFSIKQSKVKWIHASFIYSVKSVETVRRYGETLFGSWTMELSVTPSVFPGYDLRPFYTTELCLKKKKKEGILFPSQWFNLVLSTNSHRHAEPFFSALVDTLVEKSVLNQMFCTANQPFKAVPQAFMCTHTNAPLQQPFFSDVA